MAIFAEIMAIINKNYLANMLEDTVVSVLPYVTV